jgi:transposase
MFPDLTKLDIYIRPGITDLRKAVNGLSVIVSEEMDVDPFKAALFLFCNRNRKLLKAIYWDKNGFCLWQKRLEKHRFPWPESDEAAQRLTKEELSMLLCGIDFWKAHTELKYSEVS